jgi:hypothetical protein
VPPVRLIPEIEYMDWGWQGVRLFQLRKNLVINEL